MAHVYLICGLLMIAFYFKGSLDQALTIKNILTVYEEGIGQLLSPNKCSILFGKNCRLEDQVSIMVVLKITEEGFEDKYLGLPVPEGRMKAGKFQYTKDKALRRLSDWIEKYASSGAKEIQIKSVIMLSWCMQWVYLNFWHLFVKS